MLSKQQVHFLLCYVRLSTDLCHNSFKIVLRQTIALEKYEILKEERKHCLVSVMSQVCAQPCCGHGVTK